MSGSVRSGPLLRATPAAYGGASTAGRKARPCEDRSVTDAPPLLRACRGEVLDRPPVWFMRQAGRSLPEYRKVRDDVPMLEACSRTETIVELTLQPVRRYGVDAAILFSDIVVPLRAVGVGVEIEPGVGPVLEQPIRTRGDLELLRALEPSDVPFISDAVAALVDELGTTPLIGFAGAPFTLASYLVEGGPSRTHERTKALMHADPDLWHDLLARIAVISAELSCGCKSSPGPGRCNSSTRGQVPCPRPTTGRSRCRTAPRCCQPSRTWAHHGSISASVRVSCSR